MKNLNSAEDDLVDERVGAVWWIRNIVSWFVLLAMLAVVTVTILIPFVGGAERFTVLTGSMQPTYPPGTLIVVKPADSEDLRIGTAITYQLKSGESAVVTHRIVASAQNARGERKYTTQGDANGAPDTKPVTEEQIRGKVWYSIPYLGYVNNWLTGQQRAWIIGSLVIGLFTYAFAMVLSSVRDGRKGRHDKSATKESDYATRH